MIHLHHHDRDVEDPWLRARLAMLPAGARILDVGCVDGWVLDEYPTALGVDSRGGPERWGGRVECGDAERTGWPDASFDAVTCVSVLEHVGLGWYGDNVEATGEEGCKAGRVVAEMARVLKPGGWLFLTVPLGLAMTKDGRPFARPVNADDVTDWLERGGLVVHEHLDVTGVTWDAAPDDRPNHSRYVLLLAAQKPGPA